jgi:hypothetical protein
LAKRVSEKVLDKEFSRDLVPFFKLTDKGKEEIKSYRENFNFQYLKFLKLQASLFENGNLQGFVSNHFRLRLAHPDQRTLGLPIDTLSDITKNILTHLVEKKELRVLSKLPIEIQPRIRSVIGILAINFRLPAGFTEVYLEDINVRTLRELGEQFFETFPADEKNLSISDFLLFEFNTLWNHYKMEELKNAPKGILHGVQILSEGCKCEEKFGLEKYAWNEIERIPTLPRALKCSCLYNGYGPD